MAQRATSNLSLISHNHHIANFAKAAANVINNCKASWYLCMIALLGHNYDRSNNSII